MTTKSKVQDKNKLSDVDENILKLFDIKKRLGKGAYGIVWKALDKRTNETLAVKKIFDAFRDETDAQRTFREICFLQSFRSHPNVVKMLNIYKAANNLDIYLVFEYMESDLHNIIKKGTILKGIHKRYIMCQLVNAVRYIHSGNVIHRDLKPSNVLIDSKCRCKLADFGLARSLSSQVSRDANDSNTDINVPLLTDYVATRWYRAPEILVASKRYTKGIDMWSLGCILAEMIRGKPLFQGTSTINQIEKIVSALPEVTEHDINAVGAGFGSALLSKQTSEKKTSLDELIPDASSDALDMIKSLLILDPYGRLTADQAINHSYVERFRNSVSELELNEDVLIPFRDDVRLSVSEYRTKLYEIAQSTDRHHNTSHHTSSHHSIKRHTSSTKRIVPTAQNLKPKETKYLERTVNENPEIGKKISKISITSSLMNGNSSTNCLDHYERNCANSTTQPRKIISKQTLLSPTTKNRLLEANKAPHRNRMIATEQQQQQQYRRVNNLQTQLQQQQTQQMNFEKRSHHGTMLKSKTSSKTDQLYNLEKRHSIDGGYGSLPADTGSSHKTPTPVANQVNNSKVYKSSSITKLGGSDSSQTLLRQLVVDRASTTSMKPEQKYRSLHRSSSVILGKAQRNSNQFHKELNEDKPFCYDAQIKKIEAQLAGFKDDIKRFAKENKYYSRQPTPTRSTPSMHNNQKQHHQQHQQQQTQQQQSIYLQQAGQTRYPQVRSKYTMQIAAPTDVALISTTITTKRSSSTSTTLAFPTLPREKNEIYSYNNNTGGSGDHLARSYNSPLETTKTNDIYKYTTKQRHNAVTQHQPSRPRVSSKVI